MTSRPHGRRGPGPRTRRQGPRQPTFETHEVGGSLRKYFRVGEIRAEERRRLFAWPATC